MNLKKVNLYKLDKKLNFLTKNKLVFFVLMFIVVLALFNYIYSNNYYAIVVFVISCVVLSYFSKNKIVIMVLSLFITKFLVHLKDKREGFKENLEDTADHTHTSDTPSTKEDKEELSVAAHKKVNDGDVPPATQNSTNQSKGSKDGILGASVGGHDDSVNEELTQKSGFKNLEENMDTNEKEGLSEAMSNIMDSHEKMATNMKGLAPLMQQAQELTEKLTKGGMGKLLEKASQYADKLN